MKRILSSTNCSAALLSAGPMVCVRVVRGGIWVGAILKEAALGTGVLKVGKAPGAVPPPMGTR